MHILAKRPADAGLFFKEIEKWDDNKSNNVNMFHLIYERNNETMRPLYDKQLSLLQLY